MGRQLLCDLEERLPVAVLRVAGQLDLRSSVELRGQLQKVLSEQPSGVVIDVSGLVLVEDLAVTVFSAYAAVAAQWPGCAVALCGPSPELRDVLRRLAIIRTVPVHASRAEAVAEVEKLPAPRRYRVRLAATAPAGALARQTVAEACQAWGLQTLRDDAEIVATELVTNAVCHGGGDAVLTVALGPRFLHLAVRDASPVPPLRRLPDRETGHGGRGLLLVDALAASWDTVPDGSGKVVWATLRLPR